MCTSQKTLAIMNATGVLLELELKSHQNSTSRNQLFRIVQDIFTTCGNIHLKLPSGKRLHNYGKSPCYQWVNPLFLWPFSIANC